MDEWKINIIWYESKDLIRLVQDRSQWRVLVSMILNIWVTYGKCLNEFYDEKLFDKNSAS